MGSDPWDWTVHDVQTFFRSDTTASLGDSKHGLSAPYKSFLEALEQNEVAGRDLLISVDLAFLRDDCGIKILRTRTAILVCIQTLRNASPGYQGHIGAGQKGSAPEQKQATVPIVASTTSPAAADIAANTTRSRETQVRDGQGRKRRRLEIVENIPPVQPAKGANPDQFSSDKKLSTDDVFYGNVKLGAEIGRHPTPPGMTRTHSDADDDDNFEISQRSNNPAEVLCVYRLMTHFLTNHETVNVSRGGRDAVAILPYKEGKERLTSARSAAVIQIKEGGECVTIRETAINNPSGITVTSEPQPNIDGEWAFLSQKYYNDDDRVLPIFNESTASEQDLEEEDSTIVTGAAEEDSLAEEDTEPEAIDKQEARRIIDEAIESFVTDWKERRLPILERKKARTIWKKMKGSKQISKVLIEGANREVERLQNRLTREMDSLLETDFKDSAELKFSCAVIQPTVEDIEERQWEIGIYGRRQEPQSETRRVAKRTRPFVRSHQANAGASDNTLTKLLHSLGPQDRIAEPPAYHASGALENSRQPPAQNQHALNIRPPSPSISPQQNALIVNDEGHEADISNAPSPDSDEATLGLFIPEAEDHPMTELDREEPLSKETQTGDVSPPESAFPQLLEQAEMPLSRPASSGSDGGLPEVSSFVSPRKVKAEIGSPIVAKSYGEREVIYIPSDSPTSAKEEPAQSGRKPGMTKELMRKQRLHDNALKKNVEDLTAGDVEALDEDQLRAGSKREHLLVRLLFVKGADFRDDLLKCLVTPYSRFALRIQAALLSLKDGLFQVENLDGPQSETMRDCARLFVVWYDCDRLDSLDAAVDPEEVRNMSQDMEQLVLFATRLTYLLNRKDGPIFNESTVETIDVPSDTEENATTTTGKDPKKKRARRKQFSKSAHDSRKSAFSRQERYTAAIGSQSDSTVLAQMIANDDTNVELEINPVREEGQPPIYVNLRLAKVLKPHQIDGVRFMWREITAEGEDGVQGCMLAHAMGLGKTLQSITLLVSICEAGQSEDRAVRMQIPQHLRPKRVRKGDRKLRILILCPPTLVMNWTREIWRWAPHDVLGPIFTIDSLLLAKRVETLEQWTTTGGVLLLGYQMFQRLLNSGGERSKKSEEQTSSIERALLECTEVVIADEAHHLKNQKSAVAQAASRLGCKSRVALTGTPMSNDIEEIYSLVSWVAPGYLGAKDEFNQRYKQPIEQGLYNDSPAPDVRRSIKKLAVLSSTIGPKYHRLDITVLKGSIKSKVEYVLTVSLTEKQASAYRRFVEALTGNGRNENASQVTVFAWLNALTLLMNHPQAFRQKLLTKPKPKKSKQDFRSDSGDATPARSGTPDDERDADEASDAQNAARQLENIDDEDLYAHGFDKSIVDYVIGDVEDELDPALSSKTAIFIRLVEHSLDAGDKMLVFSGTLHTLDYLTSLLQLKGIKHGRIDGQMKPDGRTDLILQLEKGTINLLLISTRAGGVGLNMQCANRVVIFDSGFNPTHEEQAVGRAYRIGQSKPVLVYRFLAGGTFETNMENKQIFKSTLSKRVVDKKNPLRSAKRHFREWLYEPKEVESTDIKGWMGKDPSVLDKIIELQVEDSAQSPIANKIHAIKTMETLQEEATDAPLDEQERLEVDEEIRQANDTRRDRRSGQMVNLPRVEKQPPVPATRVPLAQPGSATESPYFPHATLPEPSSTAPLGDLQLDGAASNPMERMPLPPTRHSARNPSSSTQPTSVSRRFVPLNSAPPSSAPRITEQVQEQEDPEDTCTPS